MSESKWELFQAAYQNASLEIKSLIDSERIPASIALVLSKRNATHLQVPTIVEISNQIIGIQSIDETVKNLTDLGISEALQFIVEIQQLIKADEQTIQYTTEKQQLESEIQSTEKAFASLQGMRTMPHDIATIKPNADIAYQSSQADLLQRAVPPSTTQTDTEMPRWETDTR